MEIETKIEFKVTHHKKTLSESVKKAVSINLSKLECEVKRFQSDLKALPEKRLYISELVHKANIELQGEAEIKVSFFQSIPTFDTLSAQDALNELLSPDKNSFQTLIK